MPKETAVVYLALSPAALAEALGVSRKVIAKAILQGHLPVRQIGVKRRIWIGDAEAWFRTHWKPTVRKPRDTQSPGVTA